MSSALSSPRQMSHTETKQDLFFLVHPTCCSVPEIRICIQKCLNPLEGQPSLSMPQEEGVLQQVWGVGDIVPALAPGSACTFIELPLQKARNGKNICKWCLEESTPELHKLNAKANKEEYPLLGISNENPSKLWKWAHLTAGSLFAYFHLHMDRGKNSFTFLLVWNTKAFVKYLDK